MGLTKPRAAQIFNLDYKQSTRVVTTANITLSGGAPSLVDGVTLSLGDRVLVTGQSTASQNGLYYVSTLGTGANGTWARTSDGNENGEIEAGMIVMVTEGTVYADTQWKLITDDPIVIGTTALTFTQNYMANSISGGTSNVVVNTNAAVTISSAGTANVVSVGANAVTFAGNVNPSANVTYTLGNTTNRWKDIWLSNSSIYLGNIVLAATATALTVDGVPVVTSTANAISVTGNITGGNLTTAGLITATGNVLGNIFTVNLGNTTGAAIVNGGGNGVGNIGSATGYFNTIHAKATSAQYADLAELYQADKQLDAAQVVEFGGTHEIQKSTTSHSTRVAGIVSTNPSYLMNSAMDVPHKVPVALTGRVPCYVVGKISKGDRLVASDISGVATVLDMDLYQPGCIIGKALEDYDSQDIGKIEVAVGRF